MATSLDTPSERRDQLLAALWCLLILGAALWIGQRHRVGTFGVETDFYGHYAPQTRKMLAGQPYDYLHQPPGYCLLLAAASTLTGGDLFAAGKLLSALATALVGWLTYCLMRALYDSRTALATAVLSSLALLPSSFLAATDIVGAAAMLLPLWVLLRRPRYTVLACGLAGVLAGAAYLVRTNGIAVILGLAGSLVAVNVNREPLGNRVVTLLAFLGGVLIPVAPWLLMNWQLHGSPLASTAHLQVAAHFYLPAGDEGGVTAMQQTAGTFHSLGDVFFHNPSRVLRMYVADVAYRTPRQLVQQVLGGPAAVLAVVGAFLLARRLSRRQVVLFMVCALNFLLLGLVGFRPRYHALLFPVLFLPAAYALVQLPRLWRVLDRPFWRSAVSWSLLAALSVASGLQAIRAARRTLASEPRYLLPIAQALETRSASQDAIIVRKPHLAYLAGLRWAAFPLAHTAEEFVAQARASGARYIAYSDDEAARWSGLKALADPAAVPASLTLIYRDEPTHTLIYEVRGSAHAS